MGHNLGFQERWEFRKKESKEDSSSDDDSKSNSEQILKNKRLIVEDDYHSDEEPEVGDLGKEGKSKGKKLRKKQQPKVTKRKKMVNEKIEVEPVVSNKAPRKKRKRVGYDSHLMEDFKSFTESLLEDMKVKGEKLLAKMKEEVSEMISNGPPCRKSNKYQRSSGYDKMLVGQDNRRIRGQCENANDVFEFPQHSNGFVIHRGLPSTLNQSLFMVGGSERIETMNTQRRRNYESGAYGSESNAYPASSGRVDINAPHAIHEHSTSSFNSGMLPRNEERGQLCTWRTSSSGLEMTELERINNMKAGVSFMPDYKRQHQTMVDGNVAFRGNFSGPIILREREYEQRGSLFCDAKFTSNFSCEAASSMYLQGTPDSHIKSYSVTPSTNFIQTGSSSQRVYLGMEQNYIRSKPQVEVSDFCQSSVPHYNISNRRTSDRMFQAGTENSLAQPHPGPMPIRKVSSHKPLIRQQHTLDKSSSSR